MLNFPPDYFMDEVRDGFYVPAMMKRVWATELENLEALRTLCEKYGLRWFADYGTLLGAVRHGGFIPWDDDIDITMPRKDYMELIAHADELPEPFQLLSFYSSDSFFQCHAILKNTRAPKLQWDEERVRRFHGCPYIVDLDIFPLDLVFREEEAALRQKDLYVAGYRLLHLLVGMEEERAKGIACDGNRERSFQRELSRFFDMFREAGFSESSEDRNRLLRNRLCRAVDQVAMSCPESAGEEMDYFAHMAFLDRPILRKTEWYRAAVSLPFEITSMNAPVVYSAVLKKRFGDFYFAPVREGSAHGYPFYKKQEEYFYYARLLEAQGVSVP